MPKNEQSTLGTMTRPNTRKRSDTVPEKSGENDKRLQKRHALSHGSNRRKLIDPDPNLPADDAETRQKLAREMAVVSLGPAELLALSEQPETETTFTEDDPRACPRDLEAFRLAVALEIDRLRTNKNNYEL